MEREAARLKNEIAKLKRKRDIDHQTYSHLQDEHDSLLRKLDALDRYLPHTPPQFPTSSITMQATLTADEDEGEQILNVKSSCKSEKKRVKDLFLGTVEVDREETLDAVNPSLWQYALVFPNPDHSDYPAYEITEAEATETFKLCFTGRWRAESSEAVNLETAAFSDAFRSLEDCKTGKKMYHGGRLEKRSETVFVDTMQPPKDFATLMRNVVLTKLTRNLGVHARQILSSNGRFIYMVLFASDRVLEVEAERTQFNAQFSVAVTDVRSLEPCDELQRPLLNVEKPSNVQEILAELVTLAPPLHEKAARGSEIDGVLEEELYEPTGVSMATWETFRIFLFELCQGLRLCHGKKVSKFYTRLYYSKLIVDCMNKVNATVPKAARLRNLWDWLDIKKPIGAFADFTQNFDPGTLKDRYRYLWRTYITDDQGHRSIFRNMERMKLLHSLVSTQMLMYRLSDRRVMLEDFALHNELELDGGQVSEMQFDDPDYVEYFHWLEFLDHQPSFIGLKKSWKSNMYDFRLPLNKIRNYFGEKIALYFAFTSLLAKVLLTPAVLGTFVFVIQRTVTAESSMGITVNAFYCIFIACWATVFLEMWRRREARLALTWGMLDFTQDEQLRPQFIGDPRRSPITDELDAPHFSTRKRKFRIATAMAISLGIILIVLSIISGLYLMRWQLSDRLILFGFDFAGPAASVANAVQIQVFNIVYKQLAVKFTDNENHKTQTQYENSLVLKIFMFQFTNSFVSLYYTAFIKTYIEGCTIMNSDGVKEKKQGANCFDELFMQLVILFLVAYVKNVVEIGLPYANHVQKSRKIRNRATAHAKSALAAVLNDEHIRDDVEDQHSLTPYLSNGIDCTYEEYMEIALMYGYITVFAVAFPLSAVMSFVSFMLEIMVDRFKFVTLVRRPLPSGARTIGIWWGIFQSTTLIAIFTNAGIFCFTAPTFDVLITDNVLRFIPFALIVIVLLVFRELLKRLIPDISEKYEILMKRHQHLVGRYIRKWDTDNKGVSDAEEGMTLKVFSVPKTYNPDMVSPREFKGTQSAHASTSQ